KPSIAAPGAGQCVTHGRHNTGMSTNRAPPQPEHFHRPPRRITVAATQFACDWNRTANIDRAEALVRSAARDGAQLILLQKLFEKPYFCIEQDTRHLRLATSLADNPAVKRMAELARELDVVLPVSFFEHAGQSYFNTVAVIDAGGQVLGTYRKAHIPNGP